MQDFVLYQVEPLVFEFPPLAHSRFLKIRRDGVFPAMASETT